jgi:hypothetical protein
MFITILELLWLVVLFGLHYLITTDRPHYGFNVIFYIMATITFVFVLTADVIGVQL